MAERVVTARRVTHTRRLARLALAAIAVGAPLSLAMAMLSARDIQRYPAMPGSGIIGGGGYEEDTLDWLWRTWTPASWHAWGDGSGYDIPTRADAHDVGVLVHASSGEGGGWFAHAVAGSGFYDIVWVTRFDAVTRRAMGDPVDAALPSWEVDERVAAGEIPVTTTPAWVPADLPRVCEGFLPGRSAEVGRFFRAVDVPESEWMQGRVENEDAQRLVLDAKHVVGTRRIDEARVFGWPFRAFVVRGALIERTVYEDEGEHGLSDVSCVVIWWTDGLGIDPWWGSDLGHPLSHEIDSLPAKGLPWRPLWLPLLGNALVLGMPLVALFVLAKAGVRSAVARIRGDRTRCPSCGYARTGLSADARCPECGQPPAKTSRRP